LLRNPKKGEPTTSRCNLLDHTLQHCC
jgi:hypothetical protein